MFWLFQSFLNYYGGGKMDFLAQYQGFLLPLLLVLTMYFLIIVPQRKREKMAKEMIGSLKEGVSVVTIGGVVGKIVKINDDEVTIETSIEKTQLKFKKWSVKEILKSA